MKLLYGRTVSIIKLLFVCAVLLASQRAHAQIDLQLIFTRTGSPAEGNLNYGVNINLTASNAPNTFDLVISPSNTFAAQIGTNGGGYATFIGNFDQFAQAMTNGVWTLVLNGDTASPQTNYFTVSIGDLSSNDLPPVMLLSPTNGQVNVGSQPGYLWSGPVDFTNIYVQENNASYSAFDNANLDPSSTNWAPGAVFPDGWANMTVNYTTTNSEITISIPTNSAGVALTNWTSGGGLQAGDSISFLVGPIPFLAAHYTFDDPNYLSQDTSGEGQDLQGTSWFDQPHAATTTSISGGGGVQFFGGDWFNTTTFIQNLFKDSFSVSVWVETTLTTPGVGDGDSGTSGAGVVSAANSGYYDCVPLSQTGSKAAFYTGDTGTTLHSASSINTGNFVHVVVTRDSTTGARAIYVNGVLDSSDLAQAGSLTNSGEGDIGLNWDALGETYAGFVGVIDDLQIYSQPLNATEVAYIYNNPGQTSPRLDVTGTVAHYTFDDPGNILRDSTGNGYDLTYESGYNGGSVGYSSQAIAGGGAATFDNNGGNGGGILSWNSTPPELLSTLAGTFSVSVWFSSTESWGNDGDYAFNGAGILASDVPGVVNDLDPIALVGGNISFNTGGDYDDSLDTSVDLNDGQYHHIVITRDQASGEKQIFVDGTLNVSEMGTTYLLNAPVLLAIGAQCDASNPDPNSTSYNNGYNGLLDDLQIYSRVLQPADVTYLYQHPGAEVGQSGNGSSYNFGLALGATNLNWTTAGPAGWFVETTNTFNTNTMAVQSGLVTNNQSSTLQTTVTGPGVVGFWWECNGDDDVFSLQFEVNGSVQQTLSGYTGWVGENFVIPPGQATLTWTALANGSTDVTNAGYLDDVSFTNQVAPQITGQSGSVSVQLGSNTTLSVQEFGAPDPSLQWTKNGTPIPGATNATYTITNAQYSDNGNYQLIASNYLGVASSTPVSVTTYQLTDLIPLSVTVPAVISSQAPFPIVWTVTNTGPGAVSNFYDEFDFIPPIVTSNYTVGSVGYYYVTNYVAPGSTYTISNMFTMQAIPAGVYSLVLDVNASENIFETSYSNNYLATSNFTVINPDLQPGNLRVLGTAQSGAPVQVNFNTTNNGPGSIGGIYWADGIFFGTNSTLDGTQSQISTPVLAANLTNGQSTNTTVFVSIPNVPSGTYYLFLELDLYGSILEVTKSNNVISIPIQVTAPDLVPTNLVAPAVASVGQDVAIHWTDENIGNGVATNLSFSFLAEWDDELYISTNPVFNSSAIQLGSYQYGYYQQGGLEFDDVYYASASFGLNAPLPPGQSVTNSGTVQMPFLPPGTYYLTLEVNADGQVREGNTANNLLTRTITLQEPDLAPVQFIAPSSAISHSAIQVSFTVTNLGAGGTYLPGELASYGWNDDIYVSTNSTFDSNAVLCSSVAEVTNLPGGASYSASNSFTLPGLAQGNYHLFLVVDANDFLEEASYGNNIASLPLTIGTPDLAATSLSAPTNLSSQQPFSAFYTVTNIGAAIAVPGWSDEILISPYPTLDSNAVALRDANDQTNVVHGTAVPVNGSYTNGIFTAVPGVPAGDYYLFLDVDADHFFSESSFGNNVVSQPLHISNPYVVPTNFTAPSSITITQFNQTFDVEWSAANEGLGGAYAQWNDTIYLSRTNVLDSNAVWIGSAEISQVLLPGQSYGTYVNPGIPNDALGNFFLILDVDEDHGLYQTSYTNQTLVRPIQFVLPPLPVLSIVSISTPTDAWSSRPLQVSWVLTNSGTAAVQGQFIDSVYLTSDPQGMNSINVGNNFTFSGEIPAGSSVTRTFDITLPVSISGTYWVAVRDDVDQSVFQYNYRTNEFLVSSQPVVIHQTPTPELEVTSVQGPTNVFSGSPATVSWIVTNAGSGPTASPYWEDAVYFSASTNYNEPNYFAQHVFNQATVADTYWLGDAQNPSYLDIGGSYLNQLQVTIPQGISGIYYFVIRTDDNFQLFETNRAGNVAVSGPVEVQLTPSPNLIVTVDPPLNGFSGQPVPIMWSVTNEGLGQTVASSWSDAVYVSTNAHLDSTAVQLGTIVHNGALDPNAGYSVSTNVTLPIGISGPWYFIVTADVGNSVYEGGAEVLKTTVATNATTVALTPPPDLRATILYSPTAALSSHNLSVTYTVTNTGATVTPAGETASTDYLYLSPTANFDPATAFALSSANHSGALAPNASYTTTVSGVIPNTLTGVFYIFVMVDIGDQVFELNKANNLAVAPSPVTIVSMPANLAPLYLQAPSMANILAGIQVSYGVTNKGTGDTAVSGWVDSIVLEATPYYVPGTGWDLADVSYNQIVPAGGSYAVINQLVSIPGNLTQGTYYLYLVANSDNVVYEGTNYDDNVYGPVPIAITANSADLLVTSGESVTNAYSGTLIPVTYTVENVGDLAPNSSYWVDGVYLTTNGIVSDPSTVSLSYINNKSDLLPGASYTRTFDVALPANIQGTYDLIVVADVDGFITEPAFRGYSQLTITPPIHIIQSPTPVLVVTNIIVPATAFDNRPITITWTVENVGGAAATGSWIDAAYFSLSQDFEPYSDIYVGYTNNPTSLAPGQSYTNTASYLIPEGVSGPYYVDISADFNHDLNQNGATAQNTGFSPQAVQVELLPPVDLVVGPITIPTNAVPGKNMTITYSVTNTGAVTAYGPWSDSIYFSSTTNFSTVNDVYFASATFRYNLAPGASYTNTVTAPAPALLPGDYYVIVDSDIYNRLAGAGASNGVAASSNEVDLTIQQLTLGTPATGIMSQGQADYYSFQATAGTTIHIQLTSADALSGEELYVSEGQVPSLGDFTYADNRPFVYNPEIYIPITNTGTYYVEAYAEEEQSGPTSYSILAEVIPFSIGSVQPNFSGNAGRTTFLIQGALYDSNTVFSLVNGTNAVTNTFAYLSDSSTAFVTFDTAGLTNGVYQLEAALNSSNAPIAFLTNAVTIYAGTGPVFSVALNGPGAVAEPDCCPVTHGVAVAWENTGDGDSAPALLVYSGQEGTQVGTTPYNLQTNSIELLTRPLTGPPGIVRPQDAGATEVYFYGANEENIVVTYLPSSQVTISPSDWQTIEASVRPSGIPDSAWNAFWGNVQPRIGTTWGQYVQFLDNIALQFPASDPYVSTMIGSIYTNSPNFVAAATLSGVLEGDADKAPQAGVDVGLYTHTNGITQVVGSTTTDSNGFFSISVPPGKYQFTFYNSPYSEFDMGLTGTPDTTPPVFNLTNDLANQVIYLYEPPAAPIPTNLSAPLLVLDSAGALQSFWDQSGRPWQASFVNGTWTNAVPVTTNLANGFNVAAAPNLVDGRNPGLIAVWAQQESNGMEIACSVGLIGAGAAYEWSQPIMLTSDSVFNSSPSVSITPSGQAVVSFLKQGYDIQDDSDVYYAALSVSSANLQFPQASPDVLAENTSYTSNSVSEDFSFSKSFDAAGNQLTLSAKFAGKGTANGCTGNISASASASGSFTSGDFVGGASGGGDLTFNFAVDPTSGICDYQFVPDSSVANLNFGLDFTVKNVAFEVAERVPFVPAAAFFRVSESLLNKLAVRFGLEFDNSMKIGGSIAMNGLHWQHFPELDFGVPSCDNDTCDMTETISVGLSKITSTPWHMYDVANPTATTKTTIVGGEVNADFKFELVPDFQPLSFAAGYKYNINLGKYSYTSSGTLSTITFNTATTSETAQPRGGTNYWEGWTITYNPSSAVGTGNVYGTNAVLTNVAADLYMDGSPSLALDHSGVVYQVWAKDLNPYDPNSFGSEIYVADYNGAGWNNPVVIPQSTGLNGYVSAATDGAGNRLAVWVYANSDNVGTNMTGDELGTLMDSGDVVYSVFNGTTWSAPQPVAATPGADIDLHLNTQPNGDVVAIWVYADANSIDHLVTSTWTGSQWTPVEQITSGTLMTPTAQQFAGTTMALWTVSTDTNGDTAIYESAYINGAWAKPAVFAPASSSTNLNPSLASRTAQPRAGSFLSFPFTPSGACCMCKNVPKPLPNKCPIQSSYFNYTNCTWQYIYKPCPVHPLDPNDIIGPVGFGPQAWVGTSSTLPYTIEFANNPALASAPAQVVNIVLPIDPSLNANSFRLGSFGFGNYFFSVPPNSAYFQTNIDLTSTLGFVLNFFAGVDVADHRAFWTITTIDPATGQVPQNPLVGFLPPNTNAPAGQGFVSYTIQPLATAVTGTQIAAQATITFDNQPPQNTPTATNTLEASTPASFVLPLPTYTFDPTFTVSWEGVSVTNGDGIANYDIYVSQDGGAFVEWLQGTVLTSAPFTGLPGNSYSFYSIAHDNSGNIQPTPSSPDTTTFISTNTAPTFGAVTNIIVAPGGVASEFIHASAPSNELVTYSLATNAPAGATIDPTNGLFTWQPTRSNADTTNVITVIATDNGVPPLSTNINLVVIVLDYLQVSLGATNVQIGQSASIPVYGSSSSAATNLVFTVQAPENLLTNWSVTAVAPQVASATLANGTTNFTVTLQTTPGQSLVGTQWLAMLNFTAAPNQFSSIIKLPVTIQSGLKPTGGSYTNFITTPGNVIVVGSQAVLQVSLVDTNRTLSLYGSIGSSFQLQTSTNLAGAWQPWFVYTQTNGIISVPLTNTDSVMFYRVVQQ